MVSLTICFVNSLFCIIDAARRVWYDKHDKIRMYGGRHVA